VEWMNRFRVPMRRLFSSKSRIAFVCLILMAVLVRLPNLNESLWWDETCHTFMESNKEAIGRLLYRDVHPPLYTILMLGWIFMFGDTTVAVRIPSLIFGIASLVVLYKLVEKWFGRRTAFLATLLMTFSPVHIWYSQENKNNMLLLFFTLLAIYSLQRAWSGNQKCGWVLFICASILSLWSNHYALWVISAGFGWLWLQVLKKEGRKRIYLAIVSTILIGLAYLPFALVTIFQVNIQQWSYLRPFTMGELYKLILVFLSHGNTLRTISPYTPFSALWEQPLGFFLIDIFFACLLIVGCLGIGRRWLFPEKKQVSDQVSIEAGSELFLFYFIIPPVLLWIASFFNPYMYIERSMIILLPPFMVLIAYGIMSFRRKALQYTAMVIILLFTSWALLNLWVVKADQWTVYKPNPDWRYAAAYFDEEISTSNERFVIFCTVPSRTLNYYYFQLLKRKDKEYRKDFPPRLPLLDYNRYAGFDLFRLLFSNHVETLYIIHNTYWSGNFPSLLDRVEGDLRFLPDEKITYKGLDIYKFIL